MSSLSMLRYRCHINNGIQNITRVKYIKVPGVEKDKITMNIENNLLTVSVNKEPP